MSLKDPYNKQIFNDFISEHSPLVHRELGILRSSNKIPDHIEEADLQLAGYHGLVDALHKYDHDIASTSLQGDENPFVKYAKKRIKGEMLGHIASQDEVGGAIRRKAKKMQTPPKSE